jgi:peptidoglycan L-alanyl-D-glutamate endopeptidase CwlK
MFKTSRNIGDLDPRLQSLFVRFDIAMKEQHIDYIVTCTYRNDADQQALYDQGRKNPGKIVTNAKPGESMHNKTDSAGKPAALAFDIAILENGKIDWNASNPKWTKAGNIGKLIGLEWAGDWKSFKEYPHFQLPKGIK